MARGKKRRRRGSAASRSSAAGSRPGKDRGKRTSTAGREDRRPSPGGGRKTGADKSASVRRGRERQRTSAARRSSVRRVARLAAATLTVVLVLQLLVRGDSPQPVAAAALAAGRAAGCGRILTPAADAPGGLHIPAGAPHQYSQEPATSGPHDPSPLPDTPKVLTEPVSDRAVGGVVPESRAVHNLEHAFVIVYYRMDGPDALPTGVVDRLAALVRGDDRVLMAPHEDLPDGTSLALTAWNKLWSCPATITSTQAASVARGFIDAYRGTTNAPEAPLF
jgi:hypothetical protein